MLLYSVVTQVNIEYFHNIIYHNNNRWAPALRFCAPPSALRCALTYSGAQERWAHRPRTVLHGTSWRPSRPAWQPTIVKNLFSALQHGAAGIQGREGKLSIHRLFNLWFFSIKIYNVNNLYICAQEQSTPAWPS